MDNNTDAEVINIDIVRIERIGDKAKLVLKSGNKRYCLVVGDEPISIVEL